MLLLFWKAPWWRCWLGQKHVADYQCVRFTTVHSLAFCLFIAGFTALWYWFLTSVTWMQFTPFHSILYKISFIIISLQPWLELAGDLFLSIFFTSIFQKFHKLFIHSFYFFLFRLFVYLFIHSFIFRYFFVYLFTHLFIFIYFYVSLFIYLFIRSFFYFFFLFRLFIYFHLFIFLCLYVYLFIYSLIYLFFLYFTVYLFIPSFIYFSSFFLYLFIHSFTFPLNFVYLFIYILYALPFCQYTRHPCKVSFRDSISHSICQVLSVRYLDNINN